MAAAAETSPVPPSYQLVDSLPGVAEERAAVRAAAVAMLEARRQGEGMGSDISELIPVDPLSTAHHVLEAGRVYGQTSEERAERWDGLVLDCSRLVGEWYRKLRPEYFKPLRHTFDPTTQEFFSHGLSIRQMTENALVPILGNAEEEGRRVNERVEDATPQIMRRVLGRTALSDRTIRTISECADWAIEGYKEDITSERKHSGYGGYVPEIEKVMIRDISLDTNTDDRFEEQVGLPGVWITDTILKEALRRRDVDIDSLGKTERHGAQIVANDSLMDFVALLDEVASSEWCTNIFMGEEVEPGFKKDYASFRQEALARQESLKDLAEVVAVFVLDLAKDKVDRTSALPMVEEFVKLQLLEIGKYDKAVAEQMFDTATVVKLQEVARLEAVGAHEEAYKLMREVEKTAPGGGFCGAGSCGLESVNLKTDTGKELAKKLKVAVGDTVVRDKVRACRCGSKSIVYAYNKAKVTKFCEACGAFESKASKAP